MNHIRKSKRNPWPLAIILVFAFFFAGTVGLVVMACSQKVDLISADYYDQEIKFQEQIARLDRTRHLSQHASVAYEAATKRITISLPVQPASLQPLGSIQLYRPSDAGLDRKFTLELGPDGRQSLDASNLRLGLWRVRVSWTINGEEYFTDQQVVIRK